MNEYVVIQSVSAQVQLKSAKSKVKQYQIKFGDRLCEMSHFIESWIATAVYSYSGKSGVAAWLREIYSDIGPDEIDLFVSKFKEEHPLQTVEYSYDAIPVIATDKTYCEMALGMFKSPVKLTMNQELELLDIIKTDHEKRSKYNRMLSWFTNFCKEYGYESKFKRDRGGEANEMAWGFCMCHGLDIDVLKRAPKPQEPHQDTPAKSVWTLLLIGFLGGLYVFAAISFILWSHQMEGFGLSIVPMLIGWSMICVPIYLFFRNKKQ